MNQPTIERQCDHKAVAANDLDRDAEVVATRSRALLAFSAERVQHMSEVELASMQGILRHGDMPGNWLTPREWVTPGRSDTLLSIDLRRRIVDFLPEHLRGEAVNIGAPTARLTEGLQLAVLTLSRYLVLLRIGPTGMGRKGIHRSLDPNSILSIAYSYGPALFAQAVAKNLSGAAGPSHGLDGDPLPLGGVLGGMMLADLSSLTRSNRKDVLQECKRMRMLADRGLWWDLPSTETPSRADAMKGPVRHNEKPTKRDSHLPLPDDYVAQMGQRSLWLMRDLGPNVLAIARRMTELWAQTGAERWTSQTVDIMRGRGIRALLAAHEWRDHDGHPFGTLPFPLHLPKLVGFARAAAVDYDAEEPRWPPRSYRDVMALLGIVQLAHYFIVALSMGARQSEALGLQRDCVRYAVDGRAYANGKTYKLVQRHDGEWRDWLLPAAAVEAIEQQVRVVSLGEQLAYLNPETGTQEALPVEAVNAPNHLWAQLSGASWSNATLQLRGINKALVSFARALGMETAPGGQNLRSHRLRKTLARLVALALTQAPKLLMEVFGHKSIEMTLYYILTDKDLRAEIETVTRELRVMRAKEVVERMVEADLPPQGAESARLGGYGGLGAVSLHNAVGVHRERVHRRGDQWGANNVMELAELLTLQGKAWEQVRPGVLCTKFPGEAGPCNKSKGRPEPSKCQSTCGHRLEEAFLREDVDGSIRDSLSAYETAVADEESLTAAHWAAQVRAHVPRFADLQAKWMLNPTVQSLVGNEQGEVTA